MSKWFDTNKALLLPKIDKSRIIAFDVETTGFSPVTDAILQLTILDGNGLVLFDSYIKPSSKYYLKLSAGSKGISRSDLRNAPRFKEVKKEVQSIFDRALLLVGYNISFDIKFLEAAGITILAERFDVMTEFTRYRHLLTGKPCVNQSLKECANYFDESFTPHISSEDADVTLRCFNHLTNDPFFYKPRNRDLRSQAITYGSYSAKERTLTSGKKHPRSIITCVAEFRVPTPRYINEAIWGIALILIAECVWIHYHSTLMFNYHVYIKYLAESFKHIPSSLHDLISLALMGLGCILIIIGLVKFIIWIPRIIIGLVRKIICLIKKA